MTDKGSNKPAKNLEDVTEIDDLDVPTTNVYTRTGKAAPTEVLPASPKPEHTRAPETEQFASRQPEPAAPSEPRADKPVDITIDRVDEPAADYEDYNDYSATSYPVETEAPAPVAQEPVPASTVSTAGTLHTTEAADGIVADPAAPSATAAQPRVARGTIDVGLLILRVVLGAVLICTSLAVLFQLGGNAGLAGLEDDLASYNYPRALAIALPTMGLASGVFLVLGLLTPIASMVAVAATGFWAIDTIAGSDVATNLFAWGPTEWMAIALAAMALSVQFTGPGVFGIDFSRSWTRRPLASSWICAALGIAAAILLWWFA